LTDACCKYNVSNNPFFLTKFIIFFHLLIFLLLLQCNQNNCFSFTNGCPDRMVGSEITDDTVEPLAFAVCNTDGVEGLSWAEVDQCEVSKK
jgi:hypothetical protein